MARKRLSLFIQHWGPAIVIMIAIFLFSATPSNELPNFGGSDTLVKKGAHMLGYALLTLGFIRGMTGSTEKPRLPWGYLVLALCLSTFYAMTDEYHQSFVPGRNSRWTDVGIDTVGGMISLIIWGALPAVRKIVAYRLMPPNV
jgi:hypothetical protein